MKESKNVIVFSQINEACHPQHTLKSNEVEFDGIQYRAHPLYGIIVLLIEIL